MTSRGTGACDAPVDDDRHAETGVRPQAGNIGVRPHLTVDPGYPITGMWKPGAALPSSGQRAVITLVRV